MSSIALRLLLAAGLAAAGTAPAAAATPEETAARLGELGINAGSKKATPENLGEVTMVSLYGDKAKGLSDADCALFAGLPKLRSFNLSGARLSRACLDALAGGPALNSVSVSSAEFEPGALAALAKAPGMESILLSDVRGIAPADIGALAGLRGLRTFTLGYTMTPVGRITWFDDRTLVEVAKLTGLRALSLGRVSGTAEGMAAIAALPELRELTLDRGLFGEAALEPLAKSRLVSLNLNQNIRLGARTPAIVAKIATLQRLDLTSTAVGGNLAPLAAMPKLDTLDASYTLVTRDDLAALGTAPALQQVTMNDVPSIDDAGLAGLAASKTLRSVAFARTTAGDAGVGALLAVPTMRSLILTDLVLTDAVAAKAAKSQITNLDVSGSDLGDAGLAALADVATLTTVSTRNTRVTEAGIAAAKAKRPNFNVYK